jgi:hypothetical protein
MKFIVTEEQLKNLEMHLDNLSMSVRNTQNPGPAYEVKSARSILKAIRTTQEQR